jgi:DNA-binding beta-propeller fold protein YncE
MAVDPAQGRAYVTDGPRVRALDLAGRSLIDMTSPGGQFIGIDPVDDVFGLLSPGNGRVQSIMTYQTGFPNAGIPSGIAYDPANHSVFVIDNASSVSAPNWSQGEAYCGNTLT